MNNNNPYVDPSRRDGGDGASYAMPPHSVAGGSYSYRSSVPPDAPSVYSQQIVPVPAHGPSQARPRSSPRPSTPGRPNPSGLSQRS
jgi:hypothetical protein